MAALARYRGRFRRHHSGGHTLPGGGSQSEKRVAVTAAAAIIGFLEKESKLPVGVMGVPTKLALGLGLTLAQMNTRGTTARLLGAAADASFACYAYAASKAGAFVAGDDDVAGDDEV